MGKAYSQDIHAIPWKKAMYAEYQQAKNKMRSLQTAKANVDRILEVDSLTTARESEKDGR